MATKAKPVKKIVKAKARSKVVVTSSSRGKKLAPSKKCNKIQSNKIETCTSGALGY
jgi:hypothetical protein